MRMMILSVGRSSDPCIWTQHARQCPTPSARNFQGQNLLLFCTGTLGIKNDPCNEIKKNVTLRPSASRSVYGVLYYRQQKCTTQVKSTRSQHKHNEMDVIPVKQNKHQQLVAWLVGRLYILNQLFSSSPWRHLSCSDGLEQRFCVTKE